MNTKLTLGEKLKDLRLNKFGALFRGRLFYAYFLSFMYI